MVPRIDAEVLSEAVSRVAAASGADVPALILAVSQPSHDFVWAGHSGVRERAGDAVQPTDCFRIASLAKTFTSATIVSLVEDGLIGRHETVAQHLPGQLSRLLNSWPGRDTVSFDQLLTHTSGLHDFGRDPEYLERVGREPGHKWTAEELVELSMRRGPAVGEVGAKFHYSDTGYTILASVAERLLDRALPECYRWLLSRADLDLQNTWLEGREPAPGGAPPRIHQYFMGNDTFHLDPSCDVWGGGGLVSTCADLAAFLQALFAGRIVREPRLLQWMLDCKIETDLGDVGQFAGRGIFRTPILGVDRFGHEGFWGVWMHYYPPYDITSVGLHSGTPLAEDLRRDLLESPVRAVQEASP